jgi:hypothetical protein
MIDDDNTAVEVVADLEALEAKQDDELVFVPKDDSSSERKDEGMASSNNVSNIVLEDEAGKKQSLFGLCGGKSEEKNLTPSQELFVKHNVLKRSLFVLRLGVVADAVNTTILQPNYPM